MEIKLKDYVTINEKGEPVYKESEFNAAVDRERNSASDTARVNAEAKLRKSIEAEIRADIENKAKLSAQEQLQLEREQLENDRKSYQAERIKNLYKDTNLFSDDEVEMFCNITGKDFDETLEKANKIINARKKYNEDYDKKYKEELILKQSRNDGGNGAGGGESDIAKKAKAISQNDGNTPVEL